MLIQVSLLVASVGCRACVEYIFSFRQAPLRMRTDLLPTSARSCFSFGVSSATKGDMLLKEQGTTAFNGSNVEDSLQLSACWVPGISKHLNCVYTGTNPCGVSDIKDIASLMEFFKPRRSFTIAHQHQHHQLLHAVR